jgi:tetratricopeptide (TPR) repeat protein
MKGYTTREVAEVLGLSTSKILSWTRSGLLTPQRGSRGAYRFSFQDIVLLRTARELLAKDVPARRVCEALEALREQLPVGRPLSAVRVSALGDRILVQDDDAVWEPNSGQLQIDFDGADLPDVADVAEQEARIAHRTLEPAPTHGDMSADDWFNTALDLEAVADQEAIAAYQKALELEVDHADAHLNLGRLLHEGGQLQEAESHYRSATDADPESGRAFYNLGVALDDQGLRSGAIEAYQTALRLDADLAVAHFNLSRLFEAEGWRPDALQHLADTNGSSSGVVWEPSQPPVAP